MKSRVWPVASGLAFALLLLWLALRQAPSAKAPSHTPPPTVSTPAPAASAAKPRPAAAVEPRSKPVLSGEPKLQHTPGAAWQIPARERTFAQFQAWVQSYLAATTDAERAQLEVEGVKLAQHRREDLQAVIRSQPRRALELAVPYSIRIQLPTSIQSLLEERVDGKGDFGVLAALAEPGKESEVDPLYRTATIGDRIFKTYVYGRREAEPTRFNIPLHGIAIEDQLALDENPIRVLEPGEATATGIPLDPFCSVSTAPANAFDAVEPLEIGGSITLVCSTAHAEVLNDQLITAEAGGDGTENHGTGFQIDSAATEGVKRLLAIRVDFSDLPGAPFSNQTGTNLISNLNDFYANMSYGRTGFKLVGSGSAITPTLRLPLTAASYGSQDPGVLMTAAKAASKTAGFSTSSYDYYMVCFGAVPKYKWAGLGYVGAPGAWIRASFNEDGGVPAHELGHNFGLNHANFWDTSEKSTIGAGSNVEYGDGFDTMGNAGAGKRHFNARYKNLLNWLPNTNVLVFSTNGLYTIAAHDEPKATGYRALRILKNSATNYWVEFRQRYTNNVWLMNGVGVRWARSGTDNRQSLLLDTSPGSADGKNDSAIVLGRTFSDRISGIHITPLRKMGTQPESVQIAVYKGSFTNNQPPVLKLIPSATTAPVNGSITFTAETSDPDDSGETLAYYWTFDDSSLGTNAPSISKQWATAGQYVVRCTVSDLKGGVASDSVVVRIGSTTSFQISGRITFEGKPLQGVRVYTSNTKSTWTDTDGTYILGGLPQGIFRLRASYEGLLFLKKGFQNPLDLKGERADLDFEGVLPGDFVAESYIPSGALWRYLDDGSNQGTRWRVQSFDDSTWNEGGAQLGYGDDDVLTRLNFGGDDANKIITYYFRHAFDVEDTAGIVDLTLGVVRDDGAVVYLNDAEIFRSNMPKGTVNYTTRASESVGGSDESTFFEADLNPALLKVGRNVIAVEVHQSSPTSSDLSFNLQLEGLRSKIIKPPTLTSQLVDGTLEIRWVSDTALLQMSESVDSTESWGEATGVLIETVEGSKVARIPTTGSQRYFRLVLP